nr:immunoglobulin heavy chain junction region [Macaca mulatta]MOW18928.1 immunoglobulin heavy chain junction region [Macaca mulatta]MOW19330.1 immunoglobulin heavy chain junction region [Macaca mulatta]MOW19403.1 immunoglobulin heavy chain junction region [Macaca mulatta]MOW19531.1 immunoglobulin heavy chain junction region [Macaca mulatta]
CTYSTILEVVAFDYW